MSQRQSYHVIIIFFVSKIVNKIVDITYKSSAYLCKKYIVK